MADVTVSGSGMLEALRRRLAAEMPEQARKAVRLGVREAIERTRKKGLSIAKKRYAFSAYGRRKVDALVAEKGYGPDKALNEIRFKGEPGVPLRYFQTQPGRPRAGKLPRILDTIRVRVLRGGPMRPVYGAGGAKVFWWRSPQGKLLLMYRAGRKLSKPDRMGASPIQALQKQSNFQTVGEYLAETMEKRIRHQLDRLGR